MLGAAHEFSQRLFSGVREHKTVFAHSMRQLRRVVVMGRPSASKPKQRLKSGTAAMRPIVRPILEEDSRQQVRLRSRNNIFVAKTESYV
jgi:hypothetical protein